MGPRLGGFFWLESSIAVAATEEGFGRCCFSFSSSSSHLLRMNDTKDRRVDSDVSSKSARVAIASIL